MKANRKQKGGGWKGGECLGEKAKQFFFFFDHMTIT